MKKGLLVLLLPLLLWACKGGKKPLTDDTVEIGDFIGFFDEAKLPVTFADSSFRKKEKDSLAIHYKLFTRFVPDSLLGKQFDKVVPRLYPAGKVSVKKAETYLFVKAITSFRKVIYVLVYDKDQHFTAGMPLLISDKNTTGPQSASLDTRYTFTILHQRRTADGGAVYKKNAWVYNSAGVFTLIMTESNDMTAIKSQLINPIDTLPKHNKLSGDYTQDKMNLVSIRDTKTPGRFLFFIHFEKDGGACRGELKGIARMTGTDNAVFSQPGDPCEVSFHFLGNTVAIKEEQGCGAHRDIKCFFEGSFIRRHPPKPVKPAKKK
jgi:hypothetical protein